VTTYNKQNAPFAKCEVSVPNSAAAVRTLAIAASMSGVIVSRSAMYNRDLEIDDAGDDDDVVTTVKPPVDGGRTNAIAGDDN
jgi:hypothetical protein